MFISPNTTKNNRKQCELLDNNHFNKIIDNNHFNKIIWSIFLPQNPSKFFVLNQYKLRYENVNKQFLRCISRNYYK